MSILFVTGGEGFLGRHTARAFRQNGWTCVSLGRQRLPSGEAERWGFSQSFVGDLTPHLLQRAFDAFGAPDALVHAAGTSSVLRAEQNPYAEMISTVSATAATVEFLRAHAPACRVVYVSSAAVYGNSGREVLTIDQPPAPISEYGLQKRLCEQIFETARRNHGLESCVLRFFSLYGPGLTKQLLWDVMRRVEAGESVIRLSGTGRERRDFLYVDDAADLIQKLVSMQAPPAVVNAGSGQGVSVQEVVSQLLAHAHPRHKLQFSGEVRASDPVDLVADPSCMQGIGFVPKWPLRRGLPAFAEWAKVELASVRAERGESAARPRDK